jgi:hypothetical protein
VTSLEFEVLDARPEPYAAVPTIMLRLRVTAAEAVTLHALALRCQIRIEPQRRRYSPTEEQRLYELFGETPGWGDSLRPFLWTHVSTVAGGFTGSTELDLPIECSYDFDVAGAKYLHALGDGEIPLLFLFSGTAFVRNASGSGFLAEPIAWDSEAAFRMPVAVWRGVMDLYFPKGAWIRLGRDTLDALLRFRVDRALVGWDQTLEQLLKEAGEDGP